MCKERGVTCSHERSVGYYLVAGAHLCCMVSVVQLTLTVSVQREFDLATMRLLLEGSYCDIVSVKMEENANFSGHVVKNGDIQCINGVDISYPFLFSISVFV